MIYLDEWKSRSKPIDIPIKKQIDKVQLQSNSGNLIVILNSSAKENSELMVGIVDSTPPKSKQYKKGDKVLFHIDHMINILSSSC